MRKLSRRLTEVIGKIDGIEHSIDKRNALSDSELCLMYALGDNESHSQREVAGKCELPRTTLNNHCKEVGKRGLADA